MDLRRDTKNLLVDQRGAIKKVLSFYNSPTVPTIRLTSDHGVTCFELGKRARKRENTITDALDKNGWEISSEPVLIKSGKEVELGYVTHPSGVTLTIKPDVKIQAVDENGEKIPGKYVEGSYCGTIGRACDIDDFNQSIEREKSGNWLLPLVIGIVVGVMFFSPLFAWLMGFAGGN
ncbi:hypothetical protein [Methanoregula sp.]|uniref:hypothetical protein n=1 Tax=Methanoregula sp. TaxID=2052170 RepID=UPI003565C87F